MKILVFFLVITCLAACSLVIYNLSPTDFGHGECKSAHGELRYGYKAYNHKLSPIFSETNLVIMVTTKSSSFIKRITINDESVSMAKMKTQYIATANGLEVVHDGNTIYKVNYSE